MVSLAKQRKLVDGKNVAKQYGLGLNAVGRRVRDKFASRNEAFSREEERRSMSNFG